MKHPLFLLLLLAGATLNVASADERELAIWSALVNHGLDGDVPIVVIAAQTSGDAAALASADDASAVVTELGAPLATLADWLRRNQRPYSIEGALNLGSSYQMLSDTDRADIFAAADPLEGWQQFERRYPGAPGILRLSRPGLDDTLSHALVYVEYQCGAACGSGRLVYLQLADNGAWQVSDGALVWMAE